MSNTRGDSDSAAPVACFCLRLVFPPSSRTLLLPARTERVPCWDVRHQDGVGLGEARALLDAGHLEAEDARGELRRGGAGNTDEGPQMRRERNGLGEMRRCMLLQPPAAPAHGACKCGAAGGGAASSRPPARRFVQAADQDFITHVVDNLQDHNCLEHDADQVRPQLRRARAEVAHADDVEVGVCLGVEAVPAVLVRPEHHGEVEGGGEEQDEEAAAGEADVDDSVEPDFGKEVPDVHTADDRLEPGERDGRGKRNDRGLSRLKRAAKTCDETLISTEQGAWTGSTALIHAPRRSSGLIHVRPKRRSSEVHVQFKLKQAYLQPPFDPGRIDASPELL